MHGWRCSCLLQIPVSSFFLESESKRISTWSMRMRACTYAGDKMNKGTIPPYKSICCAEEVLSAALTQPWPNTWLGLKTEKIKFISPGAPISPIFSYMDIILFSLERESTCSFFFFFCKFSVLLAKKETLILHYLFSKYKELTITTWIFCFIKLNRNQFSNNDLVFMVPMVSIYK